MPPRRFEFHWFLDHVDNVGGRLEQTPQQARELIFGSIEEYRPKNDALLVAVMGLGFFTDSYILFTGNAILPMLGYVYWHSETHSSHEVAFNTATLSGCIFGMVLFGCLADRFGRRKMYGIALVVLIIGTFGVVTSSTGFVPIRHDFNGDYETTDWGYRGSMNIIAWLLWWRFVSGVGLGGDYPLTATLVAENAPTSRRGMLLACVFYAQALGIACAAIVTLVVVLAARAHVPEPSPRTIDQVWRWVMGLSLVLAGFAMILRLNIPESPRFRMDVQDDLWRAFEETDRFRNTGLLNEQLDYELVRRTAPPDRDDGNDPQTELEQHNHIRDHPRPPQTRRQRALARRDYFKTKGNWRHLVGTSIAWFMLDIAFYTLSLNSPQIMSKLWYQAPERPFEIKVWDAAFDVADPDKGIYDILIANCWHALVVTSSGALLGGAGMIYSIRKRNRRIFQLQTFIALGLLFLVTGPVYWGTVYTGNRGITIALYIACEVLFYYGPNTLTFIIPAEIFPTPYRASCHGISAAFGKLGSLVIKLILAFAKINGRTSGAIDSVSGDPSSNWLGWVITFFSLAMFIGAWATSKLIPDVQNAKNENLTLEECAVARETKRQEALTAEAARQAEEQAQPPPPPSYGARDEARGTALAPNGMARRPLSNGSHHSERLGTEHAPAEPRVNVPGGADTIAATAASQRQQSTPRRVGDVPAESSVAVPERAATIRVPDSNVD